MKNKAEAPALSQGASDVAAAPKTVSDVAPKKDLKTLFADYDAAQAKVDSYAKSLEKYKAMSSDIVKQIAEAIAPKKLIKRSGAELRPMRRGDTWFFRGSADPQDAVEVE